MKPRPPKEPLFTMPYAGGFQRGCVRNVVQLLAGLLCGGLGLLCGQGLQLAVFPPAGFLFGVIAAGILLAFIPPRERKVRLSEIRRCYRLERTRPRDAMIIAILFLALIPWLYWRVGKLSGLLVFFCIHILVASVILIIYSRVKAQRLRDWKCPRCAHPLGNNWTICPECDLALAPNDEPLSKSSNGNTDTEKESP